VFRNRDLESQRTQACRAKYKSSRSHAVREIVGVGGQNSYLHDIRNVAWARYRRERLGSAAGTRQSSRHTFLVFVVSPRPKGQKPERINSFEHIPHSITHSSYHVHGSGLLQAPRLSQLAQSVSCQTSQKIRITAQDRQSRTFQLHTCWLPVLTGVVCPEPRSMESKGQRRCFHMS
jgi:hypothetical protein